MRPVFHWRFVRVLLDTRPQQYLLFLFAFVFARCLLAFFMTTSVFAPNKALPFQLDDYLGSESYLLRADGELFAAPIIVNCIEQERGIREVPDLFCIRVGRRQLRVNRHELPEGQSLASFLREGEINSSSVAVLMFDSNATYEDMVFALDELHRLSEESALSFRSITVGRPRPSSFRN